MTSPKLIAEFHAGRLSREEFVALYFGTPDLNEQQRISFLLREFAATDSARIEQGMTILFLLGIYSPVFSSVLCDLLNKETHFAHENIALYLEDLKDPATTACLITAIDHRFSYLAYDDSYDLAKTCIRALASIATPEALAKLQFLSNNTNSDEESREFILASYARHQLSLHAQ
jgi:HEAT repeat protein